MTYTRPPAPRQFLGIVVSSTFEDIRQHREALIRAISGQGLHPIAMEYDSALPTVTVIDSSLQKVRDGAAYVGIIGARYGNIPESAMYNPEGLSLTELEFREARDLGRPILMFIMGPDHNVKQRDVEWDPEKRRKLEAFREEAKRSSVGSLIHRVYTVFNSLNEFEVAATQSVAELRRFLDAQATAAGQPSAAVVPDSAARDGIPAPPEFYAEPPYIGSHVFVGRAAQLAKLSDWAGSAGTHPVLLFDAIGGTGKSMLTWEWATRHAPAARDDWAGLFWYSFYEKGAIMADFCRRALAYMTGRPLNVFRQKKQLELNELLLRQLRTRCWLLILDGLERVLVAYHRYDAAQLADEQAGRTDTIARRDPCSAIRPFDDDLLRQLAASSASKILITSRLMPRVLLNSANQPIPGVIHERLPGLRPTDAEALLRTCGVRGDSEHMQGYLQQHCDSHPLVIGVVAGLINDYLPARGDFDAWAADTRHGGQLNLADLNLIQKRNHILTSAIETLPEAGRRLLSTLSLLPDAADYAILAALNPHRPPEPMAVPEPQNPEDDQIWEDLTDQQKEQLLGEYAIRLDARRTYERAYAAWQAAPETLRAADALARTVRDLEQRGLVQYDRRADRWDLHPVVRAVSFNRVGNQDRLHLGQQIVDFFSQRPRDPYESAESLEDLRDGITVVRTLVQMGRVEEAWSALSDDLINALYFNLEAYAEMLLLLQPFFTNGWSTPTEDLAEQERFSLMTEASLALSGMGELKLAIDLDLALLKAFLQARRWHDLRIIVSNLARDHDDLNRLALAERYAILALGLSETLGNSIDLFRARLTYFTILSEMGRFNEAEEIWNLLDPMGRDWPRGSYQQGNAELIRLYYTSMERLTEADLASAEHLARTGKNRMTIRLLHQLRGKWQLARGENALAAESLQEAVRMAHEAGFTDCKSETMLTLARFHLQQLPAARDEALRLSAGRYQASFELAELWYALEDTERATIYAQAAYRFAWADGEPYVRRRALERAKALLQQLDADILVLPAYDSAQYPKLPWEEEIEAVITKRQRSA